MWPYDFPVLRRCQAGDSSSSIDSELEFGAGTESSLDKDELVCNYIAFISLENAPGQPGLY